MAEHCNLYDRAMYYDVIFNRDVTNEAKFVEDVYSRYNHGKKISRVIDVACGPGYHARAFARRGIEAYGLDLRHEMLKFADDQARQENARVHWIEADMRTFRLPSPVDAAFCMFDGLDCLLTNENLVKHFQAVAANLTQGGIYIVDLSHPAEIDWTHYKKFHYSGQRDGTKVDIHWATNNPRYDLATGIAQVSVEMHINDHGKEIVVKDTADERIMFPQEISLLAELSGALKVVGWYGDFDVDQPLDYSPKSCRMIGVLQRIG